MSVVVIGLSHRTSPVEVRERFAFAEAEIPAAVAELRRRGLAEEGVIVSTCNRVELYLATPRPPAHAFPALHQFLSARHTRPEPVRGRLYNLAQPRSLEHLFKVACGLDSMVLGETEILGQLKQAYDLALKHNLTGPRLNKAFQRAFNVAKHVRATTNIQRGCVSVASVAVELAGRVFDSLAGHPVLVIGAGGTSEKTARALQSRGADRLVVANRTSEKAVALARELGGRAIGFDELDRELARVDIVISSTSAPGHVIERARVERLMKARRHRPLLLIDIAVPRDVDPAVHEVDNVYLYNTDDLQGIANEYLQQRREEVTLCESIIGEKVGALLRDFGQFA